MTEKIITCIVCPQGCAITVKGEDAPANSLSMTGQGCKRGEEYARNEFLHPLRILTSTVRVSGSTVPLVAVRTSKPIPKELLFKGMEEIRKITTAAPVKRGNVIIPNILGTGAELIATADAL